MTVLEYVERERARLRRLHVAAGVALAAAVTLGFIAFGALLLGNARWIELPRPVPFLVWGVIAAVDLLVVRWTWRRLVRETTRSGIAAAIEREQALRAGAVRGVIEVAGRGALGRRAEQDLSRKLDPGARTLAPTTQRRARRSAAAMLVAAGTCGLLLGGVAPAFGDGVLAVLRPDRAWRGTLLPALGFRALPPQVMRGEMLDLEILAPDRSTITLAQRTTGEGWRSTRLAVPRGGIVRARVGPMRGDLMLVASDGRASTDTTLVRVTDRPFVGAVSMRAVYPAYLGRAPEGLPIGEPATVPRGTIVELTGRASTELHNVELVNGTSRMALRASGRSFSGRFEARESGKWTWSATGALGPVPDVPLPLELTVVQDSAPRVDIQSPATDTLVAGDDQIPLRLTASDDHGLATIDLESWKQGPAGATPAIVTQRLAAAQSTVWSGTATLDLAPRGLQPGDALHVRVVAVDNSPWAQRGESRELLLRIPTMEERRDMARSAADSAVRAVEATAAAQKALEDRTEQVSRERQRTSSGGDESSSSGSSRGDEKAMSYEAAEQARAVAKEQRALAERVQNLQRQAAALQQQLAQAGALDSSLARQLREAQAMLQQALTPELMEQMKKLEDAAQQLSGEQARQAMRDLAAMQQRLREQLEKSAEMLKRAAVEGSMQTLHDEAKDIAQRERQLADSARSSDADTQREQARRLAERSQRFADEVQKLQQRLQQDKAEAGARRTDDARRHAEASEEKMRAASQDPRTAGDQQQRSTAGEQRRSSSGQEQRSAASEQKSGAGQKASGGQPKSGAGEQRSGSGAQRDAGAGSQSGGSGDEKAGGAGEMQQSAQDASAQMEQAAQAMQDARSSQVAEWKKELTGDLDQTIQELLQMSRQESAMEQQARSGSARSDDLRGQQSAVKQGVDEAAQRIQKAGQKSSLLSSRSQRAMAEAQQKVADAMQQMAGQRPGAQSAGSLGDAADALNRAAASLARDRERVNSASSASGFAEMLQQLQEMAKRQGAINAQAQGLMPIPGASMSAAMQATARALARQQRALAQQLDDLGQGAGGDRAAELAKEARQVADALEGGRIDATTIARQQQLFRRLLDAGRSLEKNEREDSNKRVATAAKGDNVLLPTNTNATGASATKFREPTWDELRGLSADERRAILDYFKRINEQKP